ncbi:polymorphic toxin type 44 domain-containing protein [Lentibacillus salicampi]|uniref:polymorphic toxin type 44 domain-containing protein n=1 Tax=Lentibacillus salicampi TaxID=175306 RepID=UPI0014302158|nr:polymorphic toxin type 44 domain-containing protein [Lentibacillus salicampi]
MNIALSGTAFWWKGEVEAGGPWDYKSVSGFAPYNKTWSAQTYTGTQTMTSEYIGNYNYGYTGEFLFPEQILLWGGEYAGGHLGTPEDAGDRNAIKAGFSDGETYAR